MSTTSRRVRAAVEVETEILDKLCIRRREARKSTAHTGRPRHATAGCRRRAVQRARMTSTPPLRLSVSAVRRSGSPVLLGDSGPLFDLAAVRRAVAEIDSAIDTHADLLFEGGAELVIRLAERNYAPLAEVRRSAKHLTPRPGEF